MTFQSVKQAVTPLIIAGVDGNVTVKDRSQLDTLIPPIAILPCVLLRDRPSTEVPLAVGIADRVWWLEAVLWNVYAVDTDQSSFDTIREQLAAVFRNHTYLGGDATDAQFGTQVYVSGRSLQMHDYPATPSGMGQVLRHCTVSCEVRESIQMVGAI